MLKILFPPPHTCLKTVLYEIANGNEENKKDGLEKRIGWIVKRGCEMSGILMTQW